jgi:hypothetical protein
MAPAARTKEAAVAEVAKAAAADVAEVTAAEVTATEMAATAEAVGTGRAGGKGRNSDCCRSCESKQDFA